jgi:O-antigen ligase
MSSTSLLFHRILNLSLPPLSITPRLYTPLVAAAVVLAGLAIALWPLRAVILLVAGTIFLTLVLIRPILNLYALILVIPFSSLAAISAGDFKVGLMELILAVGLAAWLLQILAGPTLSGRPFKIKTGPLAGPFLLFLGGVSLSWLETRSFGASLIETAKWVEMLLVYLFVINLLTARHLGWVVLAFILTGLAQALLGLYQFIFKVGPEGFLLFEGRFLRAYGAFAQPNPYGGYLGLLLPLILAITLWAFTSRPGSFNPTPLEIRLDPSRMLGDKVFVLLTRLARTLILSLPLGLLLAALYASQSRGAWLGFAAAGLVIFLVRSKQSALLLTALALVVALAGLVSAFDFQPSAGGMPAADSAYSVIIQRLADAIAVLRVTDVANTPVTDANFANLERLAHWQAASAMWRDNPWLGAGFGNYAVVYPAYAIGRWLDPLGHAHNYLLNLGAETGLIGIIAYLIFWFSVFGVLWRAIRHSDGLERAIAVGGMGIMVHLHIHNLVDNLYVQGMYLHIAIVLGLISIIHQPNSHRSIPEEMRNDLVIYNRKHYQLISE